MNAIVSFCRSAMLAAVLISASGCGDRESPLAEGRKTTVRDQPASVLGTYGELEGVALRVRTDVMRGRVWVLDDGQVRVYNRANRKLIRQISLPGWSLSMGACEPDLVLDRSGSAFISSNVVTTLWQVDADTLRVAQHDISLDNERRQWDTGFSALAFGPDGTLYALTASWGAVWKVDVPAGVARAVQVNDPPGPDCAFSVRFLHDFEAAHKPWTRDALSSRRTDLLVYSP